ncbi:MAG TPA: NUDIX hydrolase [Arthrobacter sp.]|nr:NUDIX hydrolase [Arthrobacter sp.]
MSSTTKRRFPLATEQFGAAQSWFELGERSPRKPRLASSVSLLRDSPNGLETYLTYRSANSPLGTVGFPGGSVEAGDDDAVGWLGPSPAKWAQMLGIGDPQLARRHVIAAIRETFEESGVLLAGPDMGTLVEETRGDDWMRDREAVAAQEQSFASIMQRRGLCLRTDLIKPLSHWLSPDFAHRRFDTYYFTAAVPVNQTASVLRSKGVWGQWMPAAKVVAERESTALGDAVGDPETAGRTLSDLTVPATELILEKMAQARGCIAYLSHKRPIRLYQPELVERDGAMLLEVDMPVAAAAEGAPARER